MIKLGVDVRNLTKPLTGIGSYTFEFCKYLLEEKKVELYLYAPSSLIEKCEKALRTAHLRTSNFTNILGRQVWAETVLPYQVHQDKLDVFWGPAHRLPLFLPKSIKKIVTIHDLVWKYFPETMHTPTKWLDQLFMPLALKKADIILANSYHTKKTIEENFHHLQADVQVIYPGVVNNRVNSSTLFYDFPQNFILFVGTLEPRKNLERLLKAYALLSSDIKENYPLLIAGGKGWGNLSLESLIRELNIQKNVHILGYVDDEKLQYLYAHCSFLAFPSLYEGFGLPIIEVIKFGKRVLTSHTSAMPEIAGEYGVYVDPLNVQSIYKGLLEMIQNPQVLRQNHSFSWQKSIAQFKKILSI